MDKLEDLSLTNRHSNGDLGDAADDGDNGFAQIGKDSPGTQYFEMKKTPQEPVIIKYDCADDLIDPQEAGNDSR